MLALIAIVLWTLLMAGALQSMIETGTVMRSLAIDLGDPQVTETVLFLLERMETAGPIALAAAWAVGVGVILIIGALLLALVRFVWNATSTWSPRRRAEEAAGRAGATDRKAETRPRPAPADRAGPWARVPPVGPPPDAAAGEPAPPESHDSPPQPSHLARTGRKAGVRPAHGSVVLQRPRGHMDE